MFFTVINDWIIKMRVMLRLRLAVNEGKLINDDSEAN